VPGGVDCVALSLIGSRVNKFLTALLGCLRSTLQASLLQGFLPLESEWRVLVGATAAASVLLVLFLQFSLLQGFLPLKGERSSTTRAATIWPQSDGLMKIGGGMLSYCLPSSGKHGSPWCCSSMTCL
jgi:hypothetical protein